MQFFGIFSIIVFTLLVGCSGVTTTTTENSLFGKVFDKDGKEAAHSPVKLYRKQGKDWEFLQETVSNTAAKYEFVDLSDGIYQVAVDINGEEGAVSGEVNLIHGEREYVPLQITIYVSIVINITEINIQNIVIENNYYGGYYLIPGEDGSLQIKGSSQGLDTLYFLNKEGEEVTLEIDFDQAPPLIREIQLAGNSEDVLSSAFSSSEMPSSAEQSSSSIEISSSLSSSEMISSSSLDSLEQGFAVQLFHLPLRENFAEIGGTNFLDTNYGTPSFLGEAPFDWTGSAFFDGAGDFSLLDFENGLRIGFPIAISLWVKPLAPINGGDFFASSVQTGDYTGLRVGFNANRTLEMTIGTGGAGSSGRRTAYSTKSIPFGEFSHIVYLFHSDTEFSMFINGAEETSYTYSGTGVGSVVYGNGPAILAGHALPPYPYSFHGNIVELRLFSGTPTAEQIQNLATGM